MLANYINQVDAVEPKQLRGTVESVKGLTVRVLDFPAAVDSAVVIDSGEDLYRGRWWGLMRGGRS